MTPPTVAAQPHSLEAEKTVLGALLLDPDALHRVRGSLSPEDFYDPVYRGIYQACEKLYDDQKAIDFVTVSETLSDNKKIQEIGGSAFSGGPCHLCADEQPHQAICHDRSRKGPSASPYCRRATDYRSWLRIDSPA